jgi:twitching motility two-component system response regulator PilH
MRCRREERVSLRLRTIVSGVDRRGRAFREIADTLDFSTLGARLSGLSSELDAGAVVSLVQGDRCARFRVTWVGDSKSSNEGQVGLHCIEVATNDTKRILYVDDQINELCSRASLLRTGGYEVQTTETAVDAWQRLLEDRFDLMILDYPTADADATAVVNSVREYWPAMRILVNTALPSNMPESLLSNVDDWIHKGVPGAELVTRVSSLIGKSSRLNWPVARTNHRHAVEIPIELRIFRAGVAVTLRGRSLDMSASGIGMHLEEHIAPGELATAYFQLPNSPQQFITRVMARRRNGTYCGLEFVDLSSHERDAIAAACTEFPLVSTPNKH